MTRGANNTITAINYPKTTKELLDVLNSRQREVIERRFGLKEPRRETLEEIGHSYEVSRERIRQIQNNAFQRLQSVAGSQKKVFQQLHHQIEQWGGLRREDKVLAQLAGGKFMNHLFFLLHLGEPFQRQREDEEFYTVWLTNQQALPLARKTVAVLVRFFEKEKSVMPLEDLYHFVGRKIAALNEPSLLSYLEATKQIEQAPTGQFGLSIWPEITPRGVKDKAYLALKKAGKPMHFREITQLINALSDGSETFSKREALPQTVHNELIKDPRFILIGRGIYALREWGYEDGTVKDVIYKILNENKKPMAREEIVEAVSVQRQVQPNTILLNLNNKKYFRRDSQGNYILSKA